MMTANFCDAAKNKKGTFRSLNEQQLQFHLVFEVVNAVLCALNEKFILITTIFLLTILLSSYHIKCHKISVLMKCVCLQSLLKVVQVGWSHFRG